MKGAIYIAICLLTVLVVASCKRNVLKLSGSSSLNIVNAINGSSPVVTNFTAVNAKGASDTGPLQYYNTANQVAYLAAYKLGDYIGNTDLSIAQISDTSRVIWSGSLDLAIGSIHT